jgi:hypothetical protein
MKNIANKNIVALSAVVISFVLILYFLLSGDTVYVNEKLHKSHVKKYHEIAKEFNSGVIYYCTTQENVQGFKISVEADWKFENGMFYNDIVSFHYSNCKKGE